MQKLNTEFAIQKSLELTAIAMEHSMIKVSPNPEDTANNVYKFVSTLFDNFTSEKSEDN